MQNHAISTSNVAHFPGVKPGHRLAPAAIGRSFEAPQIVFVQCPDFCVEDHIADRQVAVEDIVHTSEVAHVGIGSFLSPGLVFELYASIKSDAGATDPELRKAHIVLDDGSGEDAFLTEDMAEAVADKLIGLASEIRHQARTARLANQTAVDSDPDMDEALRRVRAGGAA